MINIFEVNETNKMIEQENLDVRTLHGISLLDCIDSDLDTMNEKSTIRLQQKQKIWLLQVIRLQQNLVFRL